eukprot:15335832-Ditylum_brightwellii.AAC.1
MEGGRHLGHYKALLSCGPDDPQSDAGNEMREKQDSLIGVHVDLLRYVLKHRYSFDRWKIIVKIIIPTKNGNNKIHKLCATHIYEADYSALVGIMWRTLIKSSEARGTLNPGQVGGYAGHDANTLIFMTLTEAKFKLKTALGVSDKFYQHCQSFPFYGTGQGSTNSPTIWLIIRSTLFDIQDELGNGANFCDLLQFITMH